MELQTEVGTLLSCAKSLSLNKVKERIAYGILLDTLLIIAEEGWTYKDTPEQILQILIEGIEQLAKLHLRFEIKRLDVAIQIASQFPDEPSPDKSYLIQLKRAKAESKEQEASWPLATYLAVLPSIDLADLTRQYNEQCTQLAFRQDVWCETRKLILAEAVTDIAAIDRLEQSYESELERGLLGFQIWQIKFRCNEARREGLEAFEKVFKEVQRLAQRLQHYDHWVHAIQLYHGVLTDYLTNNNILKAQGFEHKKLLQAIIVVCQNHHLPHYEKSVSHWQSYQVQLQTYRSQLPADPHAKNIKEILARITEDYRQLLVQMLEDIQHTLGPAPCKFALMGFGSYSRESMMPYSDLEFALVLKEASSAHQPYWRALLQLLEFKALTLGEKNQKPYSGFYIDDLNPLKQKELCGTPTQIVDWVFDPRVPRDDCGMDKVNFSVLPVKWLYGDESLVKDYQGLVNARLALTNANGSVKFDNNNNAGTFPEGQSWALLRLKLNLKETLDCLSIQEKNVTNSFSIKDYYLGPLVYLVQSLCVYYSVQNFSQIPNSLIDKINFLADKGKILSDFAKLCQPLIQDIEVLRLKVQQHYQGHCEDVLWPTQQEISNVNNTTKDNTNSYQLSLLEAFTLKTFEKTILSPLASYLTSLLKSQNLLPEPLDPWVDYRPYWLGQKVTKQLQRDPLKRLKELWRQGQRVKSTVDINLARMAVAHLVYNQAYQKVPRAQHRQAYLQLMPELRPLYLYYLKEVAAQVHASLIPMLEALPDSDGNRMMHIQREKKWFQILKACVEEKYDVTSVEAARRRGKLIITCLDFDNPTSGNLCQYVVKSEVASQLLINSKEWKEKPAAQAGRHNVWPVYLDNSNDTPSLWWKLYPEQPGTEYVVSLLAERLSAGGTPSNLLVKAELGNQTYAIQITEHVPGDDLQKVIESQPYRLNEINQLSFARTLLRVLQTNPEDDKGNDYRILQQADGREVLGRLDNERAFYKPSAEQGIFSKQKTLQVKSILYCLNQMLEPWSQEMLEEVLLLNPLLVLEDVVEKATFYHAYCNALFNQTEVAKHFQQKPHPSLLTVMMAENWVKEQWNRLHSIREVVKLAVKNQTPVTGLMLLEAVQPELANYYTKAFIDYPKVDYQPQKALARFEAVTQGLYEKTQFGHVSKMPSIHAISLSINLKVDLKSEQAIAIWQSEQLSPLQAKAKLDALKVQKHQEIFESVLQGERGSHALFQQLSKRQQLISIKFVADKLHQNKEVYTITAQQNLLKAMVGIAFHQLDLSAFGDAVTDNLLKAILETSGEHLLKLDITDCILLTPKVLTYLPSYCTNLQVLICRNTFNQTNLLDGNPTALTGTYLQLRQLILENCTKIKKVAITAPLLNVLQVANCEGFPDANFYYDNLASDIYLRDWLFKELEDFHGPEYYNNRAASKDKLGRYEEAILDYSEAIKLNSRNADYYFNRAYSKASIGREKEALADFTEAITFNSKNSAYYINRASSYRYLGQYVKAIEDCNRAIQLDSNIGWYYRNRGICYFYQKKYTLALADFLNASGLDIDDPRTWYFLAKLYAKGLDTEQDDQKALSYYQKAFIAARNSPDKDEAYVWYYLGRLYHQGLSVEKDISKAKTYYQKVINSPSSIFYWRNKSQKKLQALANEKPNETNSNDNHISDGAVSEFKLLKN